MKRSRKLVVAFGILLALMLAGVIGTVVVGPPGPHFVCHRALDGALQQWALETTNMSSFPNVKGSSAQSLAVLIPYLADDTDVLRDYAYVPGLNPDDPEDLILFYLKEPSRRTWHGDTHWFGRPRRWVVLNPRMSSPDSDSGESGGELCEAISLDEFKSRLRATLDYLRLKDRPGWETAEREHTRFMDLIQE